MGSADSTRGDLPRLGTAAPSVDGSADPWWSSISTACCSTPTTRRPRCSAGIADDLIGTSVIDLVHPADVNLALASLQTVTTKRVGELITVRLRTGHGAWVYLELRGTFTPTTPTTRTPG